MEKKKLKRILSCLFGERRKNFGVETAAKCCELKRCADRVRNRTNKANLNFSPELYRQIFFAMVVHRKNQKALAVLYLLCRDGCEMLRTQALC